MLSELLSPPGQHAVPVTVTFGKAQCTPATLLGLQVTDGALFSRQCDLIPNKKFPGLLCVCFAIVSDHSYQQAYQQSNPSVNSRGISKTRRCSPPAAFLSQQL